MTTAKCYKERRALHICVECKSNLGSKYILARCKDCTGKYIKARLNTKLRLSGLCGKCGKVSPDKNYTTCTLCRTTTTNEARKLKEYRLSLKLCINCAESNSTLTHKCINCLQKDINNRKQYKIFLKTEIFYHYGGVKCACLNCSWHSTPCIVNTLNVLSIDHINNDGAEHRRFLSPSKDGRHLGSTQMYIWLRKNKYPEGYQVLCFNCNFNKYLHSIA